MDQTVLNDFSQSLMFVKEHHAADLRWVESRTCLVSDFSDFLEEYIYVVCASGFRARIAARLTEKLKPIATHLVEMQSVFKNTRKVNAIYKVAQLESKWSTIRKTLTSIDSLTQFPFIGNTTKFHFARNIGLDTSAVKPDLHLVRYTEQTNFTTPLEMVTFIKEQTGSELALGSIDFVMFIYLSHKRGQVADCCGGGFRIR
ncbi:hypothetical protein GEMRC1_004142 [Eukaryota sp. GEM-RC1]